MNESSKPLTESIGNEVTTFASHMDSLLETLPIMAVLLVEMGKQSGKRLDDFEAEHCKVVRENERKKVTIPPEYFTRWRKLNDRHGRYRLAQTLVPNSILVSLVSQYDAFLGRLLRAIFLLKPETLNASDKQLTFSQLTAFGSITDAREYIIEKEVESVLRSSHADQFKWMETRFGLTLTKDLSIWPQFIELTERRNLFVHTAGIVSNQYLTVCRLHKVALDASLKEGDSLGVTLKYFEASCECLYQLGVKLAHVLWRKILPDDRSLADQNLTNLCYELIDNERYALACASLDFACETLKKFSDETNELVFTVNRAQAYKWANNNEKAKQILGKVDWSAKAYDFRIAEAALSERWDDVYSLMTQNGKHGSLGKLQYRDWPVFKELRKQNGFYSAYERVFGEALLVDVPAVDGKTSSAKKEDQAQPRS